MIVYLILLLLSGCVTNQIPDLKGDVYLLKINDENTALAKSLDAINAYHAEYGIIASNKSKCILEVFEYNQSTFIKWLDLHLRAETTRIGQNEMKMKCHKTFIEGIEIKECTYEAIGIDIVKHTFSDKDNFISRVLCYENDMTLAKNHTSIITKAKING